MRHRNFVCETQILPKFKDDKTANLKKLVEEVGKLKFTEWNY